MEGLLHPQMIFGRCSRHSIPSNVILCMEGPSKDLMNERPFKRPLGNGRPFKGSLMGVRPYIKESSSDHLPIRNFLKGFYESKLLQGNFMGETPFKMYFRIFFGEEISQVNRSIDLLGSCLLCRRPIKTFLRILMRKVPLKELSFIKVFLKGF